MTLDECWQAYLRDHPPIWDHHHNGDVQAALRHIWQASRRAALLEAANRLAVQQGAMFTDAYIRGDERAHIEAAGFGECIRRLRRIAAEEAK